MRISIRQQLAILLVVSSLIGLAAISIATWVVNHDFVLNVAATRLRTTAVLKAAQIAANLELMQTAATFLTTRAIIQQALARYNNGSDTSTQNWAIALSDLAATLGDVGPLKKGLALQAQIYPRNVSGPAGNGSVLSETGSSARSVVLPWTNPDGSPVYLGDAGSGYPPALYPNLTISEADVDGATEYVATYNGLTLDAMSTLVLGPILVNANYSLLSLTLAIANNTSSTDVLGWLTLVVDARLIQTVQQDQRGLGETGQTLLLGPVNTTNNFMPGIVGTPLAADVPVRYLLPLNASVSDRHPQHVVGTKNAPFPANAYPAVAEALEDNARADDDVGTILRSHNEANKSVSVGYSIPNTNLVDWVVIVEQGRSEVWQPINHLRTIILACLFAVVGFNMILSFPVAHWAVLPLLRLRAATEQTIDPPRSNNPSQGSSDDSSRACEKRSSLTIFSPRARAGFVETIARWRGKKRGGLHVEQREDDRFRIPGKVKQSSRVWVKDEMTDLIKVFNEMSDELYLQYSRLEERVRQRTIELEHSKKAAEAANESKTIFVANVSHELKTPLNGILGMCAVCMEEDDPSRLKQSLGIIYKSGDLLLRTLSDLLTFSTNQVGHQVLKLDEKEFQFRDLETQVFAIFAEQAKDRQINLRVVFEEAPNETYGLPDNRKLRDVLLYGDIHRILQIVINLTSNALKFTPADGSVTVVVRALVEPPPARFSGVKGPAVQRGTSLRKHESQVGTQSEAEPGTACFINPREVAQPHESLQDGALPAGHDIYVELQVRDTGAGISEEMHHRIFEPFVQGEAGLSRKHSGTGLGLSICSQLATLMRGTISLESKLGSGSTFTVKLPLRQLPSTSVPSSRHGSASASKRSSMIVGIPKEIEAKDTAIITTTPVPEASPPLNGNATPPAPPSPAPKASLAQAATIKAAGKVAKATKEAQHDFSNVRILVAEDNKVNQEVIVRMLKLEKIFDVTIASDGQEALDLVKTTSNDSDNTTPTQPFDLIFMDVQMPRMDGITSTKLIREWGFKQPIVALTAYAEQSNVDDCYSSGMNNFIAKPIKRPQLKKVLTEYCSAQNLAKGDGVNGMAKADGAANGDAVRDATTQKEAEATTKPAADDKTT